MAVHARLKNEFTEDEKCHNLMSWLIYFTSKTNDGSPSRAMASDNFRFIPPLQVLTVFFRIGCSFRFSITFLMAWSIETDKVVGWVVVLVFYGPSTLLGHFGRGQLTYPHCSWANLLGSLLVLSAHSFQTRWVRDNFLYFPGTFNYHISYGLKHRLKIEVWLLVTEF